MSMNLMLERITENSRDEIENPTAESASGAKATTLRIFDGDTSSDAIADEHERLLQNMVAAFASGINGATNFSEEPEEGMESGATLSLEKAWHGLHYLIAGDPWGGTGPRAFLLSGGVERGDDYGYGPARYFTANEVREISQELTRIEPDDFWASFDAQAMTNAAIYPEIWDEPEENLREEYGGYFEELKAFIEEAVELGEALRVFML